MEVTTKQEPKNEPQASQVDLEEITTEFTEQEPLLSIPVDIPTASKIGNEIDNEITEFKLQEDPTTGNEIKGVKTEIQDTLTKEFNDENSQVRGIDDSDENTNIGEENEKFDITTETTIKAMEKEIILPDEIANENTQKIDLIDIAENAIIAVEKKTEIHGLFDKKSDVVTNYNKSIESITRDIDVGKALEENDYGSFDSKVVKILSGKVQGSLEMTRNGNKFFKFLGIPYAEPPLGVLRFAAPRPVRAWSGILDSSLAGVSCLQGGGSLVTGQEDCLIVNVWQPKVNDSLSLPVMVWIHGGFFSLGSGNEDFQSPVRFMDYEVIVVTMNYRLGPLGFFSLGDGVQSGNLGLWDQNLALKWVQKNIGMFGGDLARVTLFGQGAGAISVHAHLLSYQARGLFSRAIMQSGSLLYTSRFRDRSQYLVENSKTLARLLDCDNSTSTTTITCLQNISGEVLTRTGTSDKGGISREELLSSPDWSWHPVLDGDYTDNPYIVKDPLELMLDGTVPPITVISGAVADEGALYVTPVVDDLAGVAAVWDLVGPAYLLQVPPGRASKSDLILTNTITRFYTGVTNISSANEESLVEMLTDATFLAPHTQTARALTGAGARVFSYVLDYEGSHSNKEVIQLTIKALKPLKLHFQGQMKSDKNGEIHSDDLHFLFQNENNKELLTDDEMITSKLMLTLWTDFAKHLPMISWPEYSEDTGTFLSIGPDPETREDLFPERMLLWEKLVWSPLVRSLKTQKEKSKEGLAVPSGLHYMWPASVVQPVWTRHHGPWVHHFHPYTVIQL